MAHQESGQLSLADGVVHQRSGLNERLSRIEALLDWAPFEARLSVIHASRMGRRSYGPPPLFKCLRSQLW